MPGLGWARVYDSPSSKEVSANLGILTSWHFCDVLALNLDVRGMFVNDRFDGEGGGRFGEGNLSATIGLTYKFKQRSWDRSKTVYRYNYGDLESMRRKLNDMSAENDRLKKALADGDKQKAQTIVKKIASANLVTFKINRTKLSNEARPTWVCWPKSSSRAIRKPYIPSPAMPMRERVAARATNA